MKMKHIISAGMIISFVVSVFVPSLGLHGAIISLVVNELWLWKA